MRETAREQYRRMAVESATPAGLVGMLYEGVVTCLRLAMDAAQRNDIPRRVEHANRALDIIAYLRSTLDGERGGQVAATAGTNERNHVWITGLTPDTEYRYDVTVVEARNRIGGRVISFSDLVPGKNVEGGGELIGSNHPAWLAYAKQFSLQFLDVSEEDLEAPIILNGKKATAEQIPWWRRWWWAIAAAAAFVVITLVVVLFVVLGGDDPPPPGSTDTTEPPVPTQVRKTSAITFNQNQVIDLDEIAVVPSGPFVGQDNDVHYRPLLPSDGIITALNGATLAKIGPTADPARDCARAAVDATEVRVSQWKVGEGVCVRTNAGRPSTILLTEKRSALGLPPPPPQLLVTITTFEPPGGS